MKLIVKCKDSLFPTPLSKTCADSLTGRSYLGGRYHIFGITEKMKRPVAGFIDRVQ